jgi:hypothetical protein
MFLDLMPISDNVNIVMSAMLFLEPVSNSISTVGIETEIKIPISTSKPKSKFRSQHRNFDEIRIICRRNLDFVVSKQSKPKAKFRFRHRNQNS